ncbi:hypothetical protein HL653_14765 [Sphingomonas sp. AP4-R1]|uniref:hypothetical protein n=1 Tax=Sphingomonas sp. AP4-R1 TaxID=2735134 RepID=UPI001493ACE0|nr:hypothetical protein [Sphingomonas sp. AP4-R1]QJU58862.1 hypothetical protein HL653_14765 [Sphingomonas sp. AP4-R1]
MTAALPQPLNEAIAVEMMDLADCLCKLACTLATDMGVVDRHLDALQSIDLMTQIQRALADVLRGSDSVEQKVARIPVEALAARLSDAVEFSSEAA